MHGNTDVKFLHFYSACIGFESQLEYQPFKVFLSAVSLDQCLDSTLKCSTVFF